MQIIKQTSIIKSLIAYVLLALIFSLLANNVAYLHTHTTGNGDTITHAHPYNTASDNAPIKTHTHKKFEYSVIRSLVLFLIASTIIFSAIKIESHRESSKYDVLYSYLNIFTSSLRGPPSIA